MAKERACPCPLRQGGPALYLSQSNRKPFMVNFKIIPEPFETLDSILKRCKKSANQCGIFEEYKSHQAFETPSARRRAKALRARLRQARCDKKNGAFARLKGRP